MLSSPSFPAPSPLPTPKVLHEHLNLEGKKILIVEDEPSFSLNYSFELLEIGSGAELVRATNRGALDYLATNRVDAAIVDRWPADGASDLVISRLHELGVPLVEVSAWTDQAQAAVNEGRVLVKPIKGEDLVRVLSDVLH